MTFLNAKKLPSIALGLITLLHGTAWAQSNTRVGRAPDATTEEPASPWMVVPTLSVDPKLGTSFGALVGYLHTFDEQSRVSMFGLSGQYTTTDSIVGAAFARTSFGADHHRLIVLGAGGTIKNDYDDYLGTGVPLKSDDDLRAFVLRYLYRVAGDWFIGVQSIDTNYLVIGKDAFDQNVLDILGVTGFKAGGLGANIYHDSRDDENSPTRGWMLNINNIAYREWLGGDDQFDVYRMDFRGFYPHGSGNVFGVRQNNQWTADAPTAAYASIHLRGYKAGQYLGKYMSSIEAEERWRFAQHWTATLFAGVACLYGNGNDCGDDENIYPNWGAGVQYILRPKERMVINAEYAGGRYGNYGVYLKFGYGF
jgi:hypothetical protein